MIVRDVQNRKDLVLMTDTQDIRELYYDLSLKEKIKLANFFGLEPYSGLLDQGFFVTICNGEYVEIYAFNGKIPSLDKDLVRVR